MSFKKSLALLAGQVLAGAALITASLSASAADPFPGKEIHFIVPWNAGGSNDISARTLAQIASEDGVTLLVENVPGATGAIGLTKVANAEPDGYTIGMGTSSTLALIAQGLTPLRNEQFAPIARVTTDPLILLVPAKSEYGTLESFLAHVKANPGKVSVGIPGTNNLNHIFAVMTGRVVGVETLPVPYTGGSKVVGDLSGKQIEAGVLKPSESKAQIDGGLVKPIAVFANERIKALPDVPTFKEKGYNVFPYGPLVQMAYVVAPAKTPPAVREKLIAMFKKWINTEKYRSTSAAGGALVDDLTGAALTKEIDNVQKSLNEVGKKVFVAEKK
ncbi:MAG: putative exported protein [Ramlibacter sp.]|jgi:tripartite-type tricarboxylate transporter receptor subunit TctC|nr:putative exported protein [Ramlibacter sp.]